MNNFLISNTFALELWIQIIQINNFAGRYEAVLSIVNMLQFYTLCISNNLTAVSYQIGGSTFLKVEKKISYLTIKKNIQSKRVTWNLEMLHWYWTPTWDRWCPTCMFGTMQPWHCWPDTFVWGWDEALAVDPPVCHVGGTSRSRSHQLGPWKDRAV